MPTPRTKIISQTNHAIAALFGLLSLIGPVQPASAGDLQLLLPLGRQAYQTNESIDVSIIRPEGEGAPGGELVLTLSGEDGGVIKLAFADPRAAEHLHLDARLLRPGAYTLQAACNGATSKPIAIDIHSHLRKTTFKLIDWGSRAAKHEQQVLGEESLGFNLDFCAYGGVSPDDLIRGGLDYMYCCTMSGGNQMDLRKECDWSDPYVLGGGVARLSRRAFDDRTRPNCLGVHIYDEPTLTKLKNPATGEITPFNVPAQDRSYRAAFDVDPPQYNHVKPEDAASARAWTEEQRWRLLLMEAAWRLSADAIRYVKSDFIPANQSNWFWSAYQYGYYFNDARPFPVRSGHGGYDYLDGSDFAPGYFFEFGRMRDFQKPNWYLPMWSSGRNDRWRVEQYMSFMNNLQGMAKPPDVLSHRPSQSDVTDAVVETNQVMQRLGTIFTTMPVTRPRVAVLWPLSDALHDEMRNITQIASERRGHGRFDQLLYVYMGSKLIQTPIWPVVEEDIADGTLAAHHDALMLVGIDYLGPDIISAIDAFIAGGGKVLLSDDSTIKIKNAIAFNLPAEGPALNAHMSEWGASAQWDKWNETMVSNGYYKAALPAAHALKAAFEPLGFKPIFESDQPGIIASREAYGDVEYIFALNATANFDLKEWDALKGVTAAIKLPGTDRPVYDAINGGSAAELKEQGDAMAGTLRFGPGQFRVFARTARPIGGVGLFKPTVVNDYSLSDPLHVDINAYVMDNTNHPLSGSFPLRVRLFDSQGQLRYDLYRATDAGILRLSLPLAVNDPSGEYRLVVSELLNETTNEAKFQYAPPKQCGALAGATRRAVSFPSEMENVARFFRLHKDVTIVTGSTAYNQIQADRLVKILQPWNINAKIITGAEANKPRPISEEEAHTWAGLQGGARAGVKNNPGSVGFDVRGPVILLGTPQDNPIIKFLAEQKFLPYVPSPQFPGAGRGYISWQSDGVGYFNQESITLIAYDAAGMSEAVGTLYQAMAGQTPLTTFSLPSGAEITRAQHAGPSIPAPHEDWRLKLNDRPVAIKPLPGGGCVALDVSGKLSVIKSSGEIAWSKQIDGGETWSLSVSDDGNVICVGASQHVVAFDGAGKQLFDLAVQPGEQGVVPRVEFVAVSPDGKRIAFADGLNYWFGKGWHWGGRVTMLDPAGQTIWTHGGPDAKADDQAPIADCREASFSGDGKSLMMQLFGVGKTPPTACIIDAANGKLIGDIADVSPRVVSVRSGADWLVSDGKGKLSRISPEGKISAQLSAPAAAGIVAYAPWKDRLVIGTESDSSVCLLPTTASELGERAMWQHSQPKLIVKHIAAHGDLVAITWWGGLLEIIDESGNVKQSRRFDRDVTAFAWSGNHLVVALATGDIVGIQCGAAR